MLTKAITNTFIVSIIDFHSLTFVGNFSGVNAHLAEEDIPHSFVTSHSPVVAEKVHKWVKELS